MRSFISLSLCLPLLLQAGVVLALPVSTKDAQAGVVQGSSPEHFDGEKAYADFDGHAVNFG
jgi:hypothetical protein